MLFRGEVINAKFRKFLGHSVKHGGLIIPDPWLSAESSYNTSKAATGRYCSWVQVELTSTWNPHTPCMYGKVKTEIYPIIASGRQHGGHKITT